MPLLKYVAQPDILQGTRFIGYIWHQFIQKNTAGQLLVHFFSGILLATWRLVRVQVRERVYRGVTRP